MGSYIEEDFENSLELYSFQLKEDTVNAAPFFATLSYGTLEQKRNLPYLLYKLYINNFVEENVVFYMLNSLMRENPHPDILLAATDALTLIETYIIEKLEESLQSSNALENIVNFTIYSLKYIKSGFLFGEQKEEFIKKTLNMIKDALKKYPKNSILLNAYLTLLLETNQFSEIEKILDNLIYDTTNHKLLDFAVLFYIKLRSFSKLKKALEKIKDFDLSYFSETTKYLLEGNNE